MLLICHPAITASSATLHWPKADNPRRRSNVRFRLKLTSVGLKQKQDRVLDFRASRRKVIKAIGAGEGNRTLVISLEGRWKTVSDQSRLRLFLSSKRAFWGKS